MNKEITFIYVMFWSISFICLYKWIPVYKRMKKMKKIKGKVSDYTLRTTYHKNIHIYYYAYKIKGEEYGATDEIRFKIPILDPKINDDVEIYVNLNKPNETITPFRILFNNLRFIIAILSLIIPFLVH